MAALRYYLEALTIARHIGNRRVEQSMLGNLGVVSEELGDYSGAGGYYRQALEVARLINDPKAELGALNNLGDILTIQQNFPQALEHYTASQAIARQIDERAGEANAYYGLGKAFTGLGKYSEAQAAYEQALSMRGELGQDDLVVETHAGLARQFLAQGSLPAARSHVGHILDYMAGGGSLFFTQQPLLIYLTCVKVLQALGEAQAGSLLETAHTLLQERAAKIPDESMRQAFLRNAPCHGEIIELWNKGLIPQVP